EIRQAVAQHPLVPASLPAILLDDHEVFDQKEEDRQRDWSDRTLMPYSVLRERKKEKKAAWSSLAAVSNTQARQALAYFSTTPDHVLELFAEDERESVRMALLENPRLPATVLKKLLDDPSPAVTEGASTL